MSLALLITLVSVVIAGISYHHLSQTSRSLLEKEANDHLSYLMATLEVPLWNVDKDTVAVIGDALFRTEPMARLRIADVFGNVLLSAERNGTAEKIARSGTIMHRGEPVGTVDFALTTQIYQERNREFLLSFMFAALLIVVSLAALTGFVVRSVLREPLGELNRIVDAYASGIFRPQGASINYREFQPVGRVLGQMGDRISGQMDLLRETEQRYRGIFEHALEGMFQSTLEGRYVSANPALARIQGYASPEELIANVTRIGLSPEDWERFQTATTGHDFVEGFEVAALRPDGRKIWVSINARVVPAADGPALYQGSLEDITERRGAKEKINYLAAIVESTDDAILGKTLDGVIQSWNKGAEHIYGYSAAEAIGRPISIVVPPDRREELATIMARVRAGERIRHFETVRERKDGQLINVALTISPIRDASGRIVGASTIGRDITERKQAEQSLFLMNFAVNAVHEAVFMTDENARFLFVNEEACRYLGYTHEELLGMGVTDIDPNFPPDRWTAYWHNLKTQRSIILENYHKTRDGQLIPVEISTNYFEYNNVGYNLALVRDISERRRAEAEILQLNRELEHRVVQRTADLAAANKELEAFSYSVSHDLRGPLRTIDGFSQILLEEYSDALDAEGRRYLNLVRQGTVHMGRLISDILAFSRMSRSEMGMEQVDMNALAEEVFAEIKSTAPERSIGFALGNLPPIRCDRAMMRQVLSNLLGNAVKYTAPQPEPQIELSGCINDAETVYCVKDNGVGFDMQYVGKLFNVFQRLHSADEFEGTGIGLAIVRRIVERHGGRVWAESKVGEGAAFYFALPRGNEAATG